MGGLGQKSPASPTETVETTETEEIVTGSLRNQREEIVTVPRVRATVIPLGVTSTSPSSCAVVHVLLAPVVLFSPFLALGYAE